MTALDALTANWAAIEAAIGRQAEIPATAVTADMVADRQGISRKVAGDRLNRAERMGRLQAAMRGRIKYYWPTEVSDAQPIHRSVPRARNLRTAIVGPSGDRAA